MKKYFIILSGLCFSQAQAMMPMGGFVEFPADGSAPVGHPLFARVPAPEPKTPPSLATLAMRSYKSQVGDQKIKLEEVKQLHSSTQEIIRDAIIADKPPYELSNPKRYNDTILFPTIKLKHLTRVTAVAFHPQGEHFAVGEESGRITIYNKIGNIVKSFIAPCAKDAPPAIIHLDLSLLKDNLILVSKLFQAPQLLDTDGNLLVSYTETSHPEKSVIDLYWEVGHYAYKLILDGHLENNIPGVILDILKEYSGKSWKSQHSLIARFNSNLDFVWTSNLYQDKNCAMRDLVHHRDEPHRHKTFNIWDINGNRFHFFPKIYNFCMGFLEEGADIDLYANIELIGQKKFIKQNDELRTIAKTGKFALSVHKNKVYLQSLFLGTLVTDHTRLTLDQLLFLERSWSYTRAYKEYKRIKRECEQEEKQMKKGCSVS